MIFGILTVPIAVLLVIGLALLIRGVRGPVDWTSPACARCNYDLHGRDREDGATCPECGASLDNRRAVRFGRYRRNGALIKLGTLVLGVCLLMTSLAIYQRATGFDFSQLRSNEKVVEDLAIKPFDIETWREVMNRYFAGELSSDELVPAIEHFIAGLNANPGQGWAAREPLEFLTAMRAEGRIDDEQFGRLCAAYYGSNLRIQIPTRVRSGEPATLQVDGMFPEIDGVTQVFALREAQLDGEPLAVTSSRQGNVRSNGVLSGSHPWGIVGQFTVGAEPGDRELTLTFDVGGIEGSPQFTPFVPPGAKDDWPPTVFSEMQTVTVPLTVVAPGESVISLTTGAEHRDEVISSLRIASIRFQMEHGQAVGKIIFHPAGVTPVPLHSSIFVRIGDTEIPAGTVIVRNGARTEEATVRDLSLFTEDVRAVDIILRPDPDRVEGQPGWTEIWGEEILIRNVQILGETSAKEVMRQAVRTALQVAVINLGSRDGERIHAPSLPMSTMSFPVRARFRVFLRSGDYEREIGTLSSDENSRSTRITGQPILDFPPDADTAEIIFRPDLEALHPSARAGCWDEEIVIRDVPVVRPEVSSGSH